jgi:hypothetical protein
MVSAMMLNGTSIRQKPPMPCVSCISGCKKQLKSNTVPLYTLGSAGSGGRQFGLTNLVVIVPQAMQESITNAASTRHHGPILFNIMSDFVTILQGHNVEHAY